MGNCLITRQPNIRLGEWISLPSTTWTATCLCQVVAWDKETSGNTDVGIKVNNKYVAKAKGAASTTPPAQCVNTIVCKGDTVQITGYVSSATMWYREILI